MKKRSVSVWVGYLMYLLFAITTLSIVLYTISNYINYNKLKTSLSSIENTILYINNEIENAKLCFECYKKIKVKIPPDSYIVLNNGKIYGIIISNYYYNYTSNLINVSVIKKSSNFYIYNLSISSDFIGNLTIRNRGCIAINKTLEKVIVSIC